jgi:hypothetical protein
MTQEVLKLALEASEGVKDVLRQVNELVAENKALKEALAQKQEPSSEDSSVAQKRTWVGLTKDERLELYKQFEDCLESDGWEYEKAIETKLKEKNTFESKKQVTVYSHAKPSK